jgi:hypothetical protein
MTLSKKEKIRLNAMIADLDIQIERLKIRRENYKEQLTLTDVVSSCCKLKDKETITFDEYLKEQGWEQISDCFIYKQSNNYKDREELRKEYIKKIYNL